MSEIQNSKRFDLEERAFEFAQAVRNYVRELPRSLCNLEDAKRLVRSSGSVGANYIEANESLSKKDFKLRVKISRKEAKETIYWLRLTQPLAGNQKTKDGLINECTQIMRILGAIITKVS